MVTLHLTGDIPACKTPQRRLVGRRVRQKETPASRKGWCHPRPAPAAEPRRRMDGLRATQPRCSSALRPASFPRFNSATFISPLPSRGVGGTGGAGGASSPCSAACSARGDPGGQFWGVHLSQTSRVPSPGRPQFPQHFEDPRLNAPREKGWSELSPACRLLISLRGRGRPTLSPPLRPAAGRAAPLRGLLPPSLFSTSTCWSF